MRNFKTLLTGIALSVGLATASGAATLSLSTTPTAGTAVDFSGLARSTSGSINPISTTDSAFSAAGISSLSIDDRASGNNERYDSGSTFGAGPALFNTEAGELILLEEGTTGIDFGSPTFTFDFSSLVDGFGFVFADTSSSFVTPTIQAFRNGSEIFNQTVGSSYTAQTFFALSDTAGFDQVVISTTSTDGYGLASLTVGSSVAVAPSAVPLPASSWMLLAGLAGILVTHRRKRA